MVPLETIKSAVGTIRFLKGAVERTVGFTAPIMSLMVALDTIHTAVSTENYSPVETSRKASRSL